jgi:hypothetical protein
MEIDVDKTKYLMIRILIALAIVAAVWLTQGIWISWFEDDPGPEAPWAAVQSAAEDFTTAFYTVDYRDQLDWQQRVAPACSDMGWALMTEFMPQIWQLVADARLVSAVTSAEVGEPVTAGQTPVGGIPYVIVPVTVETDAPWPTAGGNTISFFAVMELVEATDDLGEVWKFQMFMSEENVINAQDAAADPAPQPAPITEEN